MRSTATPGKRVQKNEPADSVSRLAATDEILQVMFWLRGEDIAHEVAPNDLSKWISLETPEIERLMVQLLGAKLVERVVVDSGIQEGVSRFRLTHAGMQEGRRRFAEEFAELTQPRHFEHSDPDCQCENVSRFSVSLKRGLFRQLDDMIKEKGYENRSLAIADMIRDHLVEHWQGAGEFDAVGTIMIGYDPRDAQVRARCSELQEQFLDTIVSTMHVQSDLRSCVDVLVVRGKAAVIKTLADRLIGAKGVKHGKLSLTAAPRNLAG